MEVVRSWVEHGSNEVLFVWVVYVNQMLVLSESTANLVVNMVSTQFRMGGSILNLYACCMHDSIFILHPSPHL